MITADALHVTADRLALHDPEVAAPADPTALVANLPYNVAVPVMLHLLAEVPTLRRVLVMVQAEVADRLVAGPGSKTYGSPSAKLAWYGTARRAGSISRTVFWPVPGVDSALVAFERREHPRTDDRSAVFAVIDAAFAPAPQDAAVRVGRLGRVGGLCRDGAAAGQSIPPPAARCSTWTSSPGSRRPSKPSTRPNTNDVRSNPLAQSRTVVRVRAPAKINLYLSVGDLRPDGYHDLVTVFHAVDLADELTVESAARQSVRTTPPDGVPAGARNLAGVAARMLATRTSAGGPVAIDIAKQIPVAGGMAGGSADAAATLVGCTALWDLDLDRSDLAEIGARSAPTCPSR